MGAIWLGSLPDVLRSAGLTVEVYPGWETRSRSSGGYDSLLGIQVHHTGSSTTPARDMEWMWRNAPARPIGACYIDRSGTWTVGAAGATNTSGRGGPLATSRGLIPLDAGNRHLLSLEAANRGDGTPWPEPQQLSLVIGTAALNKAYFNGALVQLGDVHGHFEWTTRKVDPAGQSRYAAGSARWDMSAFRRDVSLLNTQKPPEPEGEDDMAAYIAQPPPERKGEPWLFVSSSVRPATTFDIRDGVPVRPMEDIPAQYRVQQYDFLKAAAGL